MKQLLALILLTIKVPAAALEIDEKLPLRILKTSGTKKTILINRGLEDGLVVGNHAKFFLTKGVVARGVVMKASPTRSVWAIYRLIDNAEVRPDRVLNLKISTPVKLTEDPSKMLSHEDLPQYNRGRIRYYNNTTIPYYQGRVAPIYQGEPVPEYYQQGVPVAKGGADISEEELNRLEDQSAPREVTPPSSVETVLESEASSTATLPEPSPLQQRLDQDWEVFGSYQLASMSPDVSNNLASGEADGGVGGLDVMLGVRKYFPSAEALIWRRLVPGAFLRVAQEDSVNLTSTNAVDAGVSSSLTEFGLSLDYHLNSPFLTQYWNFKLFTSLALGSVSDEFSATGEADLSGTSFSYSVGVGVNYLWSSGLGFSGALDYLSRTETYVFDVSLADIEKTTSGPRLALGLFYRF